MENRKEGEMARKLDNLGRIINIHSRKENTGSTSSPLYLGFFFSTGISCPSLELMIGAVTYTYVKGSCV